MRIMTITSKYYKFHEDDPAPRSASWNGSEPVVQSDLGIRMAVDPMFHPNPPRS